MRTVGEVRLGIVGLGRLFRVGYDPWLAEFLGAHPEVRLAAVAEPSRPALDRYARRYGCPGFAAGEDLIAKGNVNALVVNSPPWTHHALTVAAAAKGIHVLCEKPMASTAAECFDMARAAGEAGTHLQISFMRRFIPGMQYIRHAVRSGALGRVVEVGIRWRYFIPDPDSPPVSTVLGLLRRATGVDVPARFGAWRLKDPRAGGGDFRDHGGHVLDLLRFWLGEPDKICGRSAVMVPGRNEDDSTAVATFPGGTMAILTNTIHDHSAHLMADVEGHVRGERGTITFVIPGVDTFKQMRGLRHDRLPASALGKILFMAGLRASRVGLPRANQFADQLLCFTRLIRAEKAAPVYFGDEIRPALGDDGAIAEALIERVYHSATHGNRWMPCSPEDLGETLPRPAPLLAGGA